MKINRAHPILFVAALLSGCETARVVPPAPQPAPARAPIAAPAPPPAPRQEPLAAVGRDWRNAPQTPGDWRYQAESGGSAARFTAPAGNVLLTLRCNLARRSVVLVRPGSAANAVPASITSSSGLFQTSAAPMGESALAIELAASDRQLDAMAFSRGRFIVEVNGLPTLVLPAWAEVGHVIEDCR